jgi:putative hydrolase of the HAD superfamily
MIKTILFDFGDVFINLDKNATYLSLKKFGLSEFSPEMETINEAYEIGKITTTQFLDYYQQQLPKTTKKQLIDAWNSIILNFPSYRLEFLQNIKNKGDFTLILVSNTNELHINKVIEVMGEKQYQTFKNCFDGFYLSHEIGFRKPNPNIFNYILKKHNLDPQQCLFIDDTKEHTETAKKLACNTWHLNPEKEDVVTLFETLKNIF